MSIISLVNNQIDKNTFNYFGIMSATITAGSCIAAGAVITILFVAAPMWQLYLICCTAMASNAASIAHSPLRWVVWTFLINTILSILLIVVNLI